MKKVHVNGIRVIGVIGFAIIFLVFITIPNIGNTNPFESVDIIPQSAEDIINEAKGINQYSVVETDQLFTESNDSVLQQFLDSQNIDSPLSTDKFGIEIQTALFDSDGKKYLNSTTFGVSQLSVLDEQGRLLDLGSIQTSFLGFTRNVEKSTNIWGTVKFYLDDELIETKRIWASSSNQQKTSLLLVNNLSFDSTDKILPINPLFSDRKTNFTFTLSDEGRNWVDGSEHYYRVILTDIHAIVDSDGDFKKFSWNGENIAYELKVKVDGSKKVVLNTDNKVISVLKTDGELHLCGQNKLDATRGGFPSVNASPYPVSVMYSDGTKIFDAVFSGIPTESASERVSSGAFVIGKCDVFIGIPRASDIVFVINGVSYQVRTPSNQQNYNESAYFDSGYAITPKYRSNFGFTQ